MRSVLVTGSSGLVGSAVSLHFHSLGFKVYGIDNNHRKVFFGEQGDTTDVKNYLTTLKYYNHIDIDIRNKGRLSSLIAAIRNDLHLVVHAAGQPSHDLAAKIPFEDFEINANGTLYLLEACRNHCPEVPFVFLSTNKVYGDHPNNVPMKEMEMRWTFDEPYLDGIDETMSIDKCKHTLFGVSKTAADLLVQEYGRYFGMRTCVLRGGCLTGGNQAGVSLHGFLNYFVRCTVEEIPYTIFGYKGKQVRDNIHAHDVAKFIECFYRKPKSGAVYNIGGGKDNSISILEMIDYAEAIVGKRLQYTYKDEHRIGDHICYYTNLNKIRSDYPEWDVRISLEEIVHEICEMTYET